MSETPISETPEANASEPVGPLTIEHIGFLWEHQLLTTPVPALGAMPTARITLDADRAARDLRHHGLIEETDGAPHLSDFGSTVFSTLVSPHEAWWGLILLRGQAQSGTISVPQEWERFGLHEHILTIPRVYFTVSYSAGHCVMAVRAGTNVSLTLIPARTPRSSQVVELLTQILDPARQWKPADFAEIVVPHDVTAELGKVALTGDDVVDTQIRSARRTAYSKRGVPDEDIERFLAIIEDTRNVAAEMQVLHTIHPSQTTPSAVTLSLFYELGSLVIYPITGMDRQPWLRFASATDKHLKLAVETVANLPHFEFSPTG